MLNKNTKLRHKKVTKDFERFFVILSLIIHSELGMHRFCQQNYRNTKATSKMWNDRANLSKMHLIKYNSSNYST